MRYPRRHQGLFRRRLTAFLGLAVVASVALFPALTHAVGFMNGSIWFSKKAFFAGQNVRIYAMLLNDSGYDVKGSVTFYGNDQPIGTEPFTQARDQLSQIVWHDWTAVYQTAKVSARITELNAYDANGKSATVILDKPEADMAAQIFIDRDTDGDGTGDIQDTDDDGDGAQDADETKAGTDPADPDTDGDGAKDGQDLKPLDPKVGKEPDTDGDGNADPKDSDDDNDGLYDHEEEKLGTDPKKYDSDRDGVGDKQDTYPLDRSRRKQEADGSAPGPAATSEAETGADPTDGPGRHRDGGERSENDNPALLPKTGTAEETATSSDQPPADPEGATPAAMDGRPAEIIVIREKAPFLAWIAILSASAAALYGLYRFRTRR
jgi:hypothetical protein